MSLTEHAVVIAGGGPTEGASRGRGRSARRSRASRARWAILQNLHTAARPIATVPFGASTASALALEAGLRSTARE